MALRAPGRRLTERSELLAFAFQQIEALPNKISQPIITGRLGGPASVAKEFLDNLILDEQPAAQITRNPSGAIEINWLSEGELLALAVEEDESWSAWVENSANIELDSFDGEPVENLSERQLSSLQLHLKRLGEAITV